MDIVLFGGAGGFLAFPELLLVVLLFEEPGLDFVTGLDGTELDLLLLPSFDRVFFISPLCI